MTVASLYILYTAAGVAGLIGFGALALAATSWRMKWYKTADPSGTRWSRARQVLLTVCGVLAAVGAGFGVSSNHATPSPHHVKSRSQSSTATVRFKYPKDIKGQPLPRVHCVETVVGKGSPPPGDVIVISSAIKGATLVPLYADVQQSGASWHGTAYFGNSSDKNKQFSLVAVVIPAAWQNYLLSEALFYRPEAGQTWWASGYPPLPARVEDRVTVKRVGCA